MSDQGSPMDLSSSNVSRWLWLSALTAAAIFSLSSGKLLLAGGLLSLSTFAFFNDPLSPTPLEMAKPSPLIVVSWAFGLVGIILILVAAARSLL